MKVLRALVIASLLLLVLSLTDAKAGDGWTLLLRIDGTITQGVAEYVASGMAFASEKGFRHVLIVLNTDGGFLTSTERVVGAISSAPLQVAVYIPSGGRAFSAGSFIALSADKICMGPGSSLGASEPRPRDDKLINALSSWMRSLAEVSGKNSTAAELFIRENLALTADEAVRYGIADCTAKNSEEALEKIGWPSNVEEYYPNAGTYFLLVITDPLNAWVIFILGIILLLLGLTHPTFVMEGAGAMMVMLGLYAFGLIGANLAAIILMAIGAATIFLELKTGHGLLALTGALISALGLLLVYESGPLISLTLRAETIIVSLVIFSGLIGFYLYKIREVLSRKKSPLSPECIIGRIGVVKVAIEPGKEGVVLVGSELWTAISDSNEPIREGDRVKVVGIEGFKVKVVRE